MVETELTYLTIAKIGRLIQKKKISPVEVTRAFLDRISRLNKTLNAYITLSEDQALRDAKDSENAIMRGNYKGPLHGIPLAVKDNIETRDLKTTCASKLWENRVSTFNATVVDRLQEAGACLLGKLNMHEFAMGATSSHSHYGPVRNPWDTNRISGGSSGGSAASVAALLAPGALGTDTRGSVRIPSSLCGVVGLKPTYGLVSRFGVITLSWSLDHVGPVTKTVEDAAILLQAIAGYDSHDPTTIARNLPDYRAALLQGIKGIKIGIPTNFFFDHLDAEVEKAIREAIIILRELGATIEEVVIPNVEVSRFAGALISPVEAFTFHEKHLRHRSHEYQPNVRQRLLSGSLILAVDYVRAQQFRNILRHQVLKIMERIDVLLMPSVPITAPEIGKKYVFCGELKEEILNILPLHTAPWNLTGQPAISIPCGFSSNNLPIGFQIVGRPFDESKIIRVANSYEKNTPWHEKIPII